MGNDIVKFITDVLSDVAALKGVPTAIISGRLGSYLASKNEEARNILLSKLNDEEISAYDAADEDEIIGVIYRYNLAVSKGAAKENLSLLADVIAGRINTNAPLYADEFNRYCILLEDLLYEEIIILGKYAKYFCEIQEVDLYRKGISAYNAMKTEVVPNLCKTEDHLKSFLTLSMRTGLIRVESGIGGLTFSPSPFLLELVRMVNFEQIDLKKKRAA